MKHSVSATNVCAFLLYSGSMRPSTKVLALGLRLLDAFGRVPGGTQTSQM